ncbi:hypothetical protein fHeYen902_239 [Yersinia phage fHe-Yen9-02]|nr:hypothetical protein fHeYen902_239 [Yersinia phage fHe-Yen9-02]
MSNVDKESPHAWEELPAYDDLQSELYNIRTKDGVEYSFMYPNGAAFHKHYHPEKLPPYPARIPLTEVTHCQLMTLNMDDFYSIYCVRDSTHMPGWER